MKKIKLSYAIIAILAVIVLTSSVSWSAPMTARKCYAEVVTLEGHKYVMATTGCSSAPGISIIHAASCNCNKH